MDLYSCWPPPLFMVTMSVVQVLYTDIDSVDNTGAQIAVFIYEASLLAEAGQTMGPNGPVYIQGVLLFNPHKKQELWRFLTYMFVHSGYFHITFNVLIQVDITYSAV